MSTHEELLIVFAFLFLAFIAHVVQDLRARVEALEARGEGEGEGENP